ncbi:MAG: guanylate kinase [Coriobacteriia bacterium]|nr:guanylate kinase [Coriobacteriia bacterium]
MQLTGDQPRAGEVFIISGPSGAGKGTLVRELLARMPDLWLSVSATTRPPRPGEQEGVHYFFLPPEEFERLVAERGFLEWAAVHGNRYGTMRAAVEERTRQGQTVILEIDPQGARQVREAMSSAILVFIAPPTIGELRRRLEMRGSETPEQIETRLRRAAEELEIADTYDYVIINDDVAQAADELAHIVSSHTHQRVPDEMKD